MGKVGNGLRPKMPQEEFRTSIGPILKSHADQTLVKGCGCHLICENKGGAKSENARHPSRTIRKKGYDVCIVENCGILQGTDIQGLSACFNANRAPKVVRYILHLRVSLERRKYTPS